jgi:hypothetical protein
MDDCLMPVKLKGATSGDITLDVPAVAGSNTLTLPAKTGTIITSADTGTVTQAMLAAGVGASGPAFGAYQSSAQASFTSNVSTKIVFQTEEFDTNNCFDSTTNYRFTPNLEGYYQLNAAIQFNNASSSILISVHKNGSLFKTGTYFSTLFNGPAASVSTLVYLNGTTDYVEIYGATSAGGSTTYATNHQTWFNGFLARSA